MCTHVCVEGHICTYKQAQGREEASARKTELRKVTAPIKRDRAKEEGVGGGRLYGILWHTETNCVLVL